MPEIAEIKIYVRNLNSLVAGRTVDDVRGFDKQDYSFLKTRTIEKVESHGKGIYFLLSGGGNLYVHLMLTGGFAFTDRDGYSKIDGKLIALKMQHGYLIVFDRNRYAKIKRDAKKPLVPEAGGDGFTRDYFFSLLKSRTAIKKLLTDQSRIAGLGNAYADEILYAAKINPFSAANRLSRLAKDALYDAIKQVLSQADEYLMQNNGNMLSGEDRAFFKIHVKGRAATDSGEQIRVKDLSGRKTYYTDAQIMY